MIDVYDEFVDDYTNNINNSKNNSNILWSERSNSLFYNLLIRHQDDEMFKVKNLDKLLRFFIKRKVPCYNRFLYDEPDIEFKAKFSSSKNAIIFAETIRNIRNDTKKLNMIVKTRFKSRSEYIFIF